MKRNFGFALAGVSAATIGSLFVLTDLFMREAIDRKEPKVMARAKSRIAGSPKQKEAIERNLAYMEVLMKQPMETVEIQSSDGLKLVGHWYPCPNAKRVLVAMHGWRSTWASDFAAIADFWHTSGCSVLFAEQRGQGASEGEGISFGAKERLDCAEWARWASRKTENALPVYLAGISMGATTVLMAADTDLPETVRGIVADCGFTSPKAIWRHVAEKNLHLPYAVVERYVERLFRRRFHCGPDEFNTVESLRHCKVPVLFIHGTADTFVPVRMTYENAEACASPTTLFIVPDADHGVSYLVDREGYEKTALAFWRSCEEI